tara:strand:+ start:44 stop:406 length:363 start_codon:yes stop_codon:yes gene_type:complete
MRKILIIGVLSAVVVGLGVWQLNFLQANSYEAFAECLSDEGAVMYGTDRCEYCKSQKSMFGEAFKAISYVNCDFNADTCQSKGIIGYPSWFVNDELLGYGVQTFSLLGEATGCKVPEEIE